MKRILTILAVAAAITGQAKDNKISLAGLNHLAEIETVRSRGGAQDPEIQLLAIFNTPWSKAPLSSVEANVVTAIDDTFAVVSVPASKVRDLAAMPEVHYIDFGNTYELKLDLAREGSYVDDVHKGFDWEGTNMSFDGSNVVTGLMDVGIDPNHQMFLSAAGTPRVKVAYNLNTGQMAITARDVSRFTTDSSSDTHGTHVAGIMAGRAYPDGNYYPTKSATQGTSTTADGPIPFYGVATGSDIVMCGGQFSDANIVSGVQAVIDYAEQKGLPAVVNLSLGNNWGPHDGTSALSSALSRLGEKAIICIAAGNEGDENLSATKVLTAADPTMKTFIEGNCSSGFDIWVSDDRPVTVTLACYNTSTRELTPLSTISEAGDKVSSTGTTFSSFMKGSYTMTSEVNRLNNRYHVAVSGTFSPTGSGKNVAIIVEGQDGQQVWFYGYGNHADTGKGTCFSSNSVAGYTKGTPNGTISDLATGKNLIAIGAWSTRTTWSTYAGSYRYTGTGYVVGETSPFSSYGVISTGASLPIVCAPGANIISSLSRYYTGSKTEADLKGSISAKITHATASKTSYWGPMQGTSMATPFAAGVVALWLQADPTLKAQDVISIMQATADDPFTGIPANMVNKEKRAKWGAGKLNALQGIKEVLRRKSAGIQDVTIDDPANGVILSNPAQGIFSVTVPAASRLTVTLYNIQGLTAASTAAVGDTATLDAIGLTRGVYILVVDTPNGQRTSRRVVL